MLSAVDTLALCSDALTPHFLIIFGGGAGHVNDTPLFAMPSSCAIAHAGGLCQSGRCLFSAIYVGAHTHGASRAGLRLEGVVWCVACWASRCVATCRRHGQDCLRSRWLSTLLLRSRCGLRRLLRRLLLGVPRRAGDLRLPEPEGRHLASGQVAWLFRRAGGKPCWNPFCCLCFSVDPPSMCSVLLPIGQGLVGLVMPCSLA